MASLEKLVNGWCKGSRIIVTTRSKRPTSRKGLEFVCKIGI